MRDEKEEEKETKKLFHCSSALTFFSLPHPLSFLPLSLFSSSSPLNSIRTHHSLPNNEVWVGEEERSKKFIDLREIRIAEPTVFFFFFFFSFATASHTKAKRNVFLLLLLSDTITPSLFFLPLF